MSEPEGDQSALENQERSSRLLSFWAELKRRKVMRVGITYAVMACLIIQIVEMKAKGELVPLPGTDRLN